jgi:hypothetical protein
VVSQFVTDLHLPLSQVRLEAYRPPNGDDLEMLTNYFWNIDLAEALVPSLHAVELALRNSIHTALTNHYGTDMWFYQLDLLQPRQLSEFAQALEKVAKKPHPRAGRLVAQLTFGFWVTLLSAPYEQRIWQPNNYANFAAVFPNVGNVSRKQVADRFNDIRILRNRVFHYEAVWSRPNLFQEHTDIHEAIGWISPTLHQSILAVDDFPTAFQARAQVETRLKQHLGIP